MTETHPHPAVQTSKLGKQFGTYWAVKDLDLSIQTGEIYGLLGPNGAGKTTTLRMIAGLLSPTEGSVRVGGLVPRDNPMAAKKRMGFLTGNTKLYARLNPKETLLFFGQLQELETTYLRRRVEQLIEELALQDFLKQPCGTLSTGQTQRVNIARALLHEPELLILDEPTAGLDIISADFLLKAIRRVKESGRTVLFSTHILTETELLCDRIGIVHQGRLAREGTPAELLEQTQQNSLANAFLATVQPSLLAASSPFSQEPS